MDRSAGCGTDGRWWARRERTIVEAGAGEGDLVHVCVRPCAEGVNGVGEAVAERGECVLHAGRIHPEIGLLADWHETPEALIALRARRVRGNAVLTIPAG